MSAVPGAVIRTARRSDARAIAELWKLLIDAHAEYGSAFGLAAGADAALERQVARSFDDAGAGLWVAEHEGRLAAFCAARVVRPALPAAESGRLDILELFVASDARRCGLGRTLVAAASEWARERGAARVEVRVAARNDAGQAFWRSLGFGAFVDVLDRRL